MTRIPGIRLSAFARFFSLVISLSIGFAAASTAVEAQRVDPQRLPPQLRPWIDWILDAQPEFGCVFEGSIRRCEWPSELRLELNDGEGRFSFEIETLKRGPIPLPGDARLYPEELRVNGAPAPILARGGIPTVQLEAGRARVEGRFVYQELPETLSVPRLFGIVQLKRRGQAGQRTGQRTGQEEFISPRRAEDGSIWLEGRSRESADQERLSVELYRKIEDGNKLRDHTILLLDVGGRARRVELPRVLFDGATPYAITADIPVRLEADGKLSVQLSSGRHRIEIRSRLEGDRLTLERPAHEAPLPSDEYWAFKSDEAFRQLRVEGAPQVDPARVNLPDELLGLPTYQLSPGGALTLQTERRGVERRPRNELHLSRTLYLDQDGGGYSVRDRLHGKLRDGHRLDLLEGELGAVRVGNEAKLITEYEGRRGIELREESVALVADSRIEGGRGLIPAAGWSEDLRTLSATLELPPGYLLLGGSGADHIEGAFSERFDLGAIFMIVIISLIVFRLAGPVPGVLSALSLILIWGEPSAPSFLLLFLLFFIALIPELPEGRAKRIIRLGLGASALAFFMMAMPFAKEQLKRALYPQTEDVMSASWESRLAHSPSWLGYDDYASAPDEAYESDGLREEAEMATAEMDMAAMDTAGGRPSVAVKRSARELSSSLPPKGTTAPPAYDPERVVQMGEGVPDFRFRTHHLSWDGPVSAEQELRLFILSPPLYRLLSLFRVLALLTLALALFRAYQRERGFLGGGAGGSTGNGTESDVKRGTAAALIFIALGSLGLMSSAGAQPIPDKELLNELRQRILQAPECGERCVETSLASFSISEGELSARLIVNAGANASLRLPGPAKEFVPAEIRVNGRAHDGVLLGEDGFLRLRLPAGVHTVSLRGRLPDPHSLELHLGELPRRAEVEAEGYQVQGLRDDGKVADILRFDRELGEGEALGQSDDALGFFLEIERHLRLGVVNEITTSVRRISPIGSAIQLRFPLLPGEDLLTEDVKQIGESAELVLPRDERLRQFHSRLSKIDSLELRAAVGASYQERWIIDCDETIVCHYDGVLPTALETHSRLAPSFQPLPGETLTLTIERPEAAEGRALTVDNVALNYTPGARLSHSTLRMTVRASRADTLTLRIPSDAKIGRLIVAGREHPVNFSEGVLSIRIEPGEHGLELDFEEARGLSFRHELPAIDLGIPAVNVSATVNMPSERFILGTQGPSWGPAVLFWGKLALILLFAFLLGRLPGTPLRTREYAILGLGLSSASVSALVIVIAFFFAVAYRERKPDLTPRLFNLRQVALLFLTFMTVSVFFNAIHHGLLGIPDMQVEGNGSHDRILNFYQDRVDGTLPSIAFFSTKILVYRLLMLAWALYIAFASIRWARWAFNAYRHGGFWKQVPKRVRRRSAHQEAETETPREPAPESSGEGADPASEKLRGADPDDSA